MMKSLLLLLLLGVAASIPLDNEEEEETENIEPEYLDQLLSSGNFEEFSRLMDIDLPHLAKPRHPQAKGDPRFNPHLEQGDILLTPKQKEQARQGIRFSRWPGSRWDYVPYAISTNFTARERKLIEDGAVQFNKDAGGCVQWRARGSESAYVFIFPGDGCYSSLGRTGKRQTLSLAQNGCMYMGTILHEMDHAIGFMHEQCRSDRDNYIDVKYGNIKPEWRSQYDKVNEQDFDNQGPYDYYSIMHYPQRHPDVSNNLPAFEVYDQSIDVRRIGSANAFTNIDKQKIRKLYCGK